MEFDFSSIAIIFAGLSFGMVGLIMAGSALFPEQSERYKRMIPNIIIGLIIVSVAGVLIGAFS